VASQKSGMRGRRGKPVMGLYADGQVTRLVLSSDFRVYITHEERAELVYSNAVTMHVSLSTVREMMICMYK
jgi:hypothetical protein